jgi:succinoglycan biosynthesis transport protein ExoP
LGGGLFLGCLGGVLVDTLDNKISSIHEVEELTGQTLLGATPLIGHIVRQPAQEGQAQLATRDDPHSTFAEAVRSIRTATLLTGGGGRSRVILVTSSIAAEGKTVISANLAAVLSQSNRRVLLIDCDMRTGALRRRLNLPAATGLSELLAGQRQGPELSTINGLSGLDIMQSGTPPPNPSELLDAKMKDWLDIWREEYDFIVLDGPPLLPVTDAQIIHPFADITLLVARVGLTERAQLQRSYRVVTNPSKHFVGVIVNCLHPQDESYYGYYGYRKYTDNYGGGGNGHSK